MPRGLAAILLRIEERIAMRDVCAGYHAAKDRTQPRVGKHFLRKDDKRIMHIMLWYSSGDTVQVSRSQ